MRIHTETRRCFWGTHTNIGSHHDHLFIEINADIVLYVHIYLSQLCFADEDHVWVPNSSIKDVNRKTVYSGDLFIVVKAYVWSAIHFGWSDNRRTEHKCVMVSLDNTSRVLNLKSSFFKTGCLTKAKEASLSYCWLIAAGRPEGIMPFPRAPVRSKTILD